MPRESCTETPEPEAEVVAAEEPNVVLAAVAVTTACRDCAHHFGPPTQAGDCGCEQEKFDSSMGEAHSLYCTDGWNARDCERFAEKGGV